jgi:hypothetical protein
MELYLKINIYISILLKINLMKKTLLIIIASSTYLLQSCTIAKISGKGAVPVLLNQTSTQMKLVEHITLKKNINFDFTSSFDVSQLIAKRMPEKQPDAVINTTITVKYGLDNYLLNLITLGLANSHKFIVEADLMKDKN